MNRDLAAKLLEWKGSPHRKPLLLQGARQVGKTWLLKSFGQLAYQKVAYFNFEEDSGLDQLFEGKLDPERLVRMRALSPSDRPSNRRRPSSCSTRSRSQTAR